MIKQRSDLIKIQTSFRLIVTLYAFALVLLLQSTPTTAWSQTVFSPSEETSVVSAEIPENLTPAIINGLLSRLTDAEVRATLSEELQRQAAEQMAQEQIEEPFYVMIDQRLTDMFETIGTRIMRWTDRLINIHTRKDKFQQRIKQAEYGVIGMVVAVIILVGAGIGASILTNIVTSRLRARLVNVIDAGYWVRLSRTLALGAVEFLSIAAFAIATQIVLPFVRPALGPLAGMGWIYTSGVWWSWIAILVSRRTFAPYAPQIRITALQDAAALNIHKALRYSFKIGLAGWLLGGIFLNLGFGFPPAMVIVASSGTSVILYLLYSIVINTVSIQYAAQFAVNHEEPNSSTPPSWIALITP